MLKWEYAFLTRDMGLDGASSDGNGGPDGESYTLDFGHGGEEQIFIGEEADLVGIVGRLGSDGWELAGLLPLFSKSFGQMTWGFPETSEVIGELEMGAVHMGVVTLVFKRPVP
jgi:hypothetical protein